MAANVGAHNVLKVIKAIINLDFTRYWSASYDQWVLQPITIGQFPLTEQVAFRFRFQPFDQPVPSSRILIFPVPAFV